MLNRTVRVSSRGGAWLFGSLAAVTVVLLLSIFIFLLTAAAGAFAHISLTDFFLGSDWNPTSYTSASWGSGGLLVSTLLVVVVAALVAMPLGVIMAIYIAEIAAPRTREFIKPAIEMIASIPSVTLGLVGLLWLAPAVARIFNLSNGLNALTAGLLVGLTALPTIASMSEDALSNVSGHIRQASLALGATSWMTIKKVVLPAARTGLVAAAMLGLGRMIGETMIVLMVAGNSRAFPHSIFDSVRPVTATIAIEIKEVVVGSLHWQSLFALGLFLFILTFAVNVFVDILLHRRA